MDGGVLRVEGTSGLVITGFCEVSKVNLEIFSYQVPSQCGDIGLWAGSFICPLFYLQFLHALVLLFHCQVVGSLY